MAAVLGYVVIILNSLVALVISPYMIKAYGSGDYGVYRLITSFTASMTILDFGLGQTVIRFVARDKANEDDDALQDTIDKAVKLVVFICGIIIILSIVISPLFNASYSKSLDPHEYNLATKMYWFSFLEVAILIAENAASGLVAGLNHYVLVNGVKLVSVFTKIMLILGAILWIENIIFLLLIDIMAIVVRLLSYLCYIIKKTPYRIRWNRKQKDGWKSMVSYSGLSFAQHIVDQIDSNIDNLVIGAIVGASAVSIYSFGLQIFHMFVQVSMSVSNVMMSFVIGMVTRNADKSDIQKCIIRVGTIQFILLGAFDTFFLLFGREFILLWLGDEYEPVWFITLVLVMAGTIPYIMNVSLNVLRAKGYMVFRTICLCLGATFNLICTIVFVSNYGYKYAAVATAIGYIIFNTLIMGLYYDIRFGFSMMNNLLRIVYKPAICLLLTAIAVKYLTMMITIQGWGHLFLQAFVFFGVYGLLIFFMFFGKKKSNFVKGKTDNG